MTTVGIVGGIGPESTLVYYRGLIAAYRRRRPDGSYPSLVINSIDLQRMLALLAAGELEALTGYLVAVVERLAQAGARLALLAANAPHLVFDDVQRQVSVPLVSIVAAAREAARGLGLKRVGLFGARFTMQAHFYPSQFGVAGIAVVAPAPDEMDYIHGIYMGELVNGVVRAETRARLLAIARQMRARDGIDGLVLGGTELSLILGAGANSELPILDTTQLHVEQVAARAWPVELPAHPQP
jgi:aspartate racemase